MAHDERLAQRTCEMLGTAPITEKKMFILGVLSQTFHVWIRSDAISVMGAFAVVAPLVAILIGVGMIVLTKSAVARGWLR